MKLAPVLNLKALNPTSTEKQNVNLMMKVFDVRNVEVLRYYESKWGLDTKGTRQFLQIMIRLWAILKAYQTQEPRQ